MEPLSTIDIYKDADLIVETTTVCNKSCDYCPFSGNNQIKKILDFNIYINKIKKLKNRSIVAIRGGEPTIINGWFNKFVQPALDLDLQIIIETNGYFIGKDDYLEVLSNLAHKDIFMRVSFDRQHINGFNEKQMDTEFFKMAFFAEDALSLGINFGFYCVGMTENDISLFIKGTKLEPYLRLFHFLVEHNDYFEEIKIEKYLKP